MKKRRAFSKQPDPLDLKEFQRNSKELASGEFPLDLSQEFQRNSKELASGEFSLHLS
jgi:hypothetical protein